MTWITNPPGLMFGAMGMAHYDEMLRQQQQAMLGQIGVPLGMLGRYGGQARGLAAAMLGQTQAQKQFYLLTKMRKVSYRITSLFYARHRWEREAASEPKTWRERIAWARKRSVG